MSTPENSGGRGLTHMSGTVAITVGTTIYVHGAEIADPHNDQAVTWDESIQPPQPVFVVPADGRSPLAALEEIGLTVTGIDSDGNWALKQARPL